ncbi:uncharacterized protein TNCV_3842001 [Trichonephila clavipes]|nr:uncharacterized protein TNCV_3842001 [Trichonephila clavipes]
MASGSYMTPIYSRSQIGYSSRPVLWNRYPPSILAWPQSGQASSAIKPRQWRCNRKKSCPIVRRKRATASALSRCLGIEPTVPGVSHGFPRLLVSLGQDSTFINVCRYNALWCSEDQGDFRLRRLGSLLGFLVGFLIAGDPNMI